MKINLGKVVTKDYADVIKAMENSNPETFNCLSGISSGQCNL